MSEVTKYETQGQLTEAEKSLPLPIEKPSATPQSMRIVEVNEALLPAYQRAGTLEMSDEQAAALTADFPDAIIEKLPPKGLLYIPHIHVSDRLNKVFRPGQWSMIRRREWIEGNRIYAEWVMVIKGCFIGESVGCQEYRPNNPMQNYADVLEATRGEAIRRIAGKQLSCGSQVWNPAYCREWEVRKRNHGNSSPAAPKPQEHPKAAQTEPELKPSATAADVLPPKEATDTTKKWFLDQLAAAAITDIALEYFRKKDQLLPTEDLLDLPLKFVPTSKEAARKVIVEIQRLIPTGGEDEAWRAFPMHYGKNAGIPLADLDKKYLYGLWANYTVETEYNGRAKKPEEIEKDTLFRSMLDDAGVHYDFKKD